MAVPLRKSLDAALDASAAGHRAAVVAQHCAPLIAAREAEVVARLVAEYRAGTLTDPMARAGVAEIAAGRSLLDRLTTAMRQGELARQQMAQPREGNSRGVA